MGTSGRTADELARLVAACRHGDRSAFSQLYSELSDQVYGTALRVVRDPDIAADVTQDVMVEIWQKAATYNPEHGRVRAWVAVITRRRAIDAVRRSEARRSRESRYLIDGSIQRGDPTFNQVVDRDDADQARDALGTLSAHQRQAVELSFFDEKTHVQISEQLGVPLGTIKTRIRDGLKSLARDLKGRR